MIIGSGVAGVTAAQAIRQADSGAQVHLFGAERYPYYRRPLLWELIAGRIDTEALFFRPAEWYAGRGITLHLDTEVNDANPKNHQITLEDGTTVDYDRLLIATGARCFMPPCPGNDKTGVFTLRTMDDALAIREYAKHSSGAVVIGGGLLGLETARALQTVGLDVTVVEFIPYLLPRQLDEQGARVLKSILESQDLHIVTGAATEEILGGAAAEGIRLRDGRELPADIVVFSTGIRSCVQLAAQAGLKTNRGIVVDNELRTSAEDVFSVGDAAEFEGIVYGMIPAAIEQARIAGANMVSSHSATYGGTLPATTLKVAGAEVASLGDCTAEGADFVSFRYVDLDGGRYRKLVLRDGQPVGAILLNCTDQVRPVTQLIERGVDLADYAEHIVSGEFDPRSLLQ
ncbi:MAG: FAD-dependent oxidoreductase [Anaerolineae bacterium]|nr:FAD-dependent oxidoreductase [Anaerolineae bacterium]